MDRGIVIVTIDKTNTEFEVEIPLNITVRDIYMALIKAFNIKDNKNLTGY